MCTIEAGVGLGFADRLKLLTDPWEQVVQLVRRRKCLAARYQVHPTVNGALVHGNQAALLSSFHNQYERSFIL